MEKSIKVTGIDYFPDQGIAKSVISRYAKSKYGVFKERYGNYSTLDGRKPTVCTIAQSRDVIELTVSHDYVLNLIESNDVITIQSLQQDGQIYFVDNITDRILSDIDTIISNCVFMYQTMIGYHESIELGYQCSGLYPSKNNILEWYNNLCKIERNSDVYQYVDLVSDMFLGVAIDKCRHLLDSGLVFSDAIDILMSDVNSKIDKRFPDFAFATQLLVAKCSDLAKIAITRNTLSIKIKL